MVYNTQRFCRLHRYSRHCLTALQNREVLFMNTALQRKKHKFNFFFPLKLWRKFEKRVTKDGWKNDTEVSWSPLYSSACNITLCFLIHPTQAGAGFRHRQSKQIPNLQTARGHLAACSALPGRRADELFQQGSHPKSTAPALPKKPPAVSATEGMITMHGLSLMPAALLF